MIQLAWRLLRFQKDSGLARWFQARTSDGRGTTRKTMIVALARKLLIALWRLVTTVRCRTECLASDIMTASSKEEDDWDISLAAPP
ncbi:hypothetical protein [Chelativorans sp. AA-79]|uniref:hypothetical protein n=1 Tax=Chelativorans sp. AA-79 TaxID=3028735 RepID=UPI0023F6FAAD|nr:hypothetical protein [Chelativorans sp. AA-79]WEX12221.1 hypothetical protein PVE73_26275 [Chelativorans sp. AA-79]